MNKKPKIEDDDVVTYTDWMAKPHKKLLEPCPNCGAKVEVIDGISLYHPVEHIEKKEKRWKCTECGEVLGMATYTINKNEHAVE